MSEALLFVLFLLGAMVLGAAMLLFVVVKLLDHVVEDAPND